MRILIVGGTGLIGGAIATALRDRHQLVLASRSKAPEHVDVSDRSSIRALYQRVGKLDAVICAAGMGKFLPLAALTDDDIAFTAANKLMGQVNLVRYGIDALADRGSFTLTTGVLAQQPEAGGAAFSLANGGVEAFARAAAIELPRGLRVNVVSPPWITETLRAMGAPLDRGMPAAAVAPAYVACVEGTMTGQVIDPQGA